MDGAYSMEWNRSSIKFRTKVYNTELKSFNNNNWLYN